MAELTDNGLGGPTTTTDTQAFYDPSTISPEDGDSRAPPGPSTSVLEEGTHSATQAFNRPVKLSEITLDGTEVQGELLAVWAFPSTYFENNRMARLIGAGYCFFRAKNIVLRVMVAPNSGASGLLRVVFRRQARGSFAAVGTDLATITGYPGSWINLGSSETIEIKIPWFSYLDWSDLTTLYNDGFGSESVRRLMDNLEVALFNIVPLRDNTSDLVVNVLGYFEDAELIVARDPADLPTVPAVRLQGPVGKGLKASSMVAETIGSVSHLACVEVRDPTPTLVSQVDATAEQVHVNALTQAVVLAPNNQSLRPRANAKADYTPQVLAAQPQFNLAVSFPFTAVSGDILWSAGAYPGWFVGRSTEVAGQPATWSCTRLQALFLMYAYWRGGFVADFKIVKSAWHRGKLAFVYRPQDKVQKTTPFTSDEISNSYSVIFDIADQPDYSVEVPYVSQFPWGECLPTDSAEGNPLMVYDEIPGFVYLVVYNPLTTTSAVAGADAVILTGHHASSSTEFALWNPKLRPDMDVTGMTAVVNLTPEANCISFPDPGPKASTSKAPRVTLQGGDDAVMEQPGQPLQLRMLKNRMSLIPPPRSLSLIEPENMHDLMQRLVSVNATNVGNFKAMFPVGSATFLLALMFTYYKGSVKVFCPGPNGNVTMELNFNPIAAPGTDGGASFPRPGQGDLDIRYGGIGAGNNNVPVAAICPMQTATEWRPLCSGTTSSAAFTDDLSTSLLRLSNHYTTKVAAGPDVEFMGLIGYPRTYIFQRYGTPASRYPFEFEDLT